jgi:hypothetical protein
MSPPSPLSALCIANEVVPAIEAGSRAESFVMASGSDLRTASVAVMSLRSWRSTGLPLVTASRGADDFKLGTPELSAETRCLKMIDRM